MNALAERDQLFSALHAQLLKPRGYLKRGHWSVKQTGDFYAAIYLRASRWSSKNQADFWLDLKVFHEGWHTLLTGTTGVAPLKEGTPSMVYEELGEREGPQYRHIMIDAATDLQSLSEVLSQRLRKQAFPMMEQCSTLEGALHYVLASPAWPRLANIAAGICLLLGEDQRAEQYMQQAKEGAPHENARQWLESQQAAMVSNRAKVRPRNVV